MISEKEKLILVQIAAELLPPALPDELVRRGIYGQVVRIAISPERALRFRVKQLRPTDMTVHPSCDHMGHYIEKGTNRVYAWTLDGKTIDDALEDIEVTSSNHVSCRICDAKFTDEYELEAHMNFNHK